mgnify:CR=1 FL=1
MKKLQIGTIGLGRLGYQHAMNVTRSFGADLVAVADPFPDALKRGEDDFGVKGYADYHDLLDDPEIEAIIIATPTQTHYEVLMAAIPTGKPIFCEKPITFALDEAEKIVEEVERHKAFVMIGYMRRYDPSYKAAKTMIESGNCGAPIYIHDCCRDPKGPPPRYVPQSGGLFVDMGIHDLDIVRWLMGSEITEIYSRGEVLKYDFLKDMEDVDHGQMLLRFANGAIGMIEVSRNGNNVYECRTEVVGKEKTILIGQDELTHLTVLNNRNRNRDMSDWVLERFKDAYEGELQAFIDCVREGKPSPVNAYDGLVGIKLALGATESFRKGVPVSFS